MFRITTTAALVSLAVALPGTAMAEPLQASANLEAHAVADSGRALEVAKNSAAKAKALVQRSQSELKRAYVITAEHSQSASQHGLQASAQFSSSAQAQGDNLAELVERSRGSLRAAAAGALAKTGKMQAELVARIAKGVEDQQGGASTEQAQDIDTVGQGNASLTTTILVTASTAGLKAGLERTLDRVSAAARRAHTRLLAAVAELRKRSEGQGQTEIAETQSSLQGNGCAMDQAARGSKRVDGSFSAKDGDVNLGDHDVDTGDRSGTFSASGDAHVAVNGEGGSC